LLDAPKLGGRYFVLLRRLARLYQRIGPDQAADLVGTERRLGSLEHDLV